MKELSIEEKAKRYDEAISIAREYDFSLTGVCVGDIIEDVFPELKESEDEEIRKRLLEYFEGFKMGKTNVKWEGLNVKDIIAWLEKQGENDRNMKFVTDDAYQRGYDEGIKVTLEKKCEQKPVPDWMPKFLDELRLKKNYFDWEEHKDIEGGILAIIKWMNPNYFNGKDGEQKPAAWSEEDEKHIHSIISTIEYCKRENATAPFIVQHYNADLDWLKSLKDRVQPQPKQEWSEEDEKVLDNIFYILNQLKDTTPYKEDKTAKECIDKLKSLKERCTWKPSDAQMVALDGICSYIRNKADWEISQDMVSDLYKLSEQLKKLKD